MVIRSGWRRGKGTKEPYLCYGLDTEVVTSEYIPGPIAESLQHQYSEEMVALFRRSNVNPALIYAFSKTGLIVTEENRDRLSSTKFGNGSGRSVSTSGGWALIARPSLFATRCIMRPTDLGSRTRSDSSPQNCLLPYSKLWMRQSAHLRWKASFSTPG